MHFIPRVCHGPYGKIMAKTSLMLELNFKKNKVFLSPTKVSGIYNTRLLLSHACETHKLRLNELF